MFDRFLKNYYLKHKSVRYLTKRGLKYSDYLKGYFGNYRDFDILLICKCNHKEQVYIDYELNIVFDKISVETSLNEAVNYRFSDVELTDSSLQKHFHFVVFPPNQFELLDAINELIDFLEENRIKPIKLDLLKQKALYNSVA